ncbi:transcription factor Tfb4 [Tothia fuscella]|uniref:General transcription and DNA repair factor IIH subunit TFB4 n=1 Tax=Tothia fuscella TaxID=1048955 RepID=A0A9P4NNM4_9PEZI|nr:transcription factor Tfb4 [Tothia fuscella]
MEGIDATDRNIIISNATPPSILTIILDTNPIAWSALSPTLPLTKALSSLLVFINAHLAINHANQVCVIASHTDRSTWLYPTPKPTKGHRHSSTNKSNGVSKPTAEEDANKYRPFLAIEQQVLSNLRALIDDTDPDTLEEGESTQIAGALTIALTYINQQTLQASPSGPDSNYIRVAEQPPPSTSTTAGQSQTSSLVSRILVLSVSSDLSSQYISVMNAIFASQRLQIPIDVLKLAGDTVFLQQASDATGGIYLAPETEALKGGAGLLQYLMMGYLPDVTSRRWLVMPGDQEVDFRAACFCHRDVVDLGFVCSVCLSSTFLRSQGLTR